MSKKVIVCQSCGNTEWQQVEFREFGQGMRKGIVETFRCKECGQIRTQVINIQNEQRKVVIQ